MIDACGRCQSCGGPVEQGFLEDGGESSKGFTRWIPGPLDKGIFGGARRMGKPRIDVSAHRCTGCGLLTLYAGGSPADAARIRSTMERVDRPESGRPAPSPFFTDDPPPPT